MAWDLTAVSAVLNQIYAPQIADQLNQRSVTLAMVPKAIGEGKNVAWDVKLTRGTSAGSYATGADITGNDNDTEQAAVLNWKRYKAEFKVSGDAVAAAFASGPQAYTNLFDKAIKDATKNLGIALATDIFGDGTGNGGLNLDGLQAICANSGTYAGLSRATYATWQSNVLANGGVNRGLTVALLRDAEKSIFKNSGFTPDVIVTNPDLYETYESLFDSYKRVNDPASVGKADLGIEQLAFKGIPVIRDPLCPANKMFMLTKDALEFRMLPAVPMADGIELTQGKEPIVTADGNIGLQVAIELLGKTGDSYKGFVKVYGNMVGYNPNQCAVIADIQ